MSLSKNISIKVCGLTRKEEIAELSQLGVAYAGFIFYERSGRFVGNKLAPKEIKEINTLKKVGVFVNASRDSILEKAKQFGLNMLQLHGEESPEICEILREHLPVMKAFKIKTKEDLHSVSAYEHACDYFLFDTAGKLYGGNGELFNWELLKYYEGQTPFFLSGGIGPGEVEALKQFNHPSWRGIDVNSRFEDAPGRKNIPALKKFLWDLNIN